MGRVTNRDVGGYTPSEGGVITRVGSKALSRLGLDLEAELAALAIVGRAAATSLDPNTFLERLLALSVKATSADRGQVLVGGSAREPQVVARHAPDGWIGNDEAFSRTVVDDALSAEEPLLVGDVLQYPRYSQASSVEALRLHSLVCAPICQEGASLRGAIYLDRSSEGDPFTEEDRDLLGLVAQQAGPLLARALESYRQQVELRAARAALNREGLPATGPFEGVIGRSPALKAVIHRAQQFASVDVPIVIVGETGTGKELFARAIHRASSRAEGPFVAENCGALAETVLESELFGHVSGAFTGATSDKVGLIASADGGTLLLDEVDSMPIDLQVKLLRVLEEGEIRPVGSATTRRVSVRFIATTHSPLRELVEAGLMREDLSYRLAVLELTLPPLRDRREDIPLLVDHFLTESARAVGRRLAPPSLGPGTLDWLCKHSWPGNARELRNLVMGATALSGEEGVIRVDHFKSLLGGDTAVSGGRAELPLLSLQDYARWVYGQLHNKATQAEIAKTLGVSRKTLWEWRSRWGGE